uniref:Uncharacterized protein n=1 Tax=Panagrolaimus superbus TaxID=310955 RepID=A0A914Z0X0_9BILA
MLPAVPGNDAFRSCNSSADLGKQVSCNGPCLTYIIEDPDELGKKLYVRGCQSELSQVQTSPNYNNGNGGQHYCEYDENFRRPTSLGTSVQTKILVERCVNTTLPCNKRINFPGESDQDNNCNDSKNNNTVNNEALSCYECEDTNENCKKGKCSKKYCVKSVAKVQGTYSTKKFCSNVNPFGTNEVCSAYDLTVTLFNINNIGGHSNICFCKNKQYCNSSTRLTFGLSTILMFFAAKTFF